MKEELEELTELHQVIMEKEGCTTLTAQHIFDDLQEEVRLGKDPERVLFDYGLEPDYVFDLLPL